MSPPPLGTHSRERAKKSAVPYNTLDQGSNSLELIKIIKSIAYTFESQQSIYLALDNAQYLSYAYQQACEMR